MGMGMDSLPGELLRTEFEWKRLPWGVLLSGVEMLPLPPEPAPLVVGLGADAWAPELGSVALEFMVTW